MPVLRFLSPFLLLPLLWATGPVCADETPIFPWQALVGFNPEPPRGWAYIVTTTRNGETTEERFTPSLPPEQRWTLLGRNGRTPTNEEAERHRRYKTTVSLSSARPVFMAGDIDRASVHFLRHEDGQLVFAARFREDLDDALLENLELTLWVDAATSAITRCRYQLVNAFSPSLGMKMQELEVTIDYYPSVAGQPSLPRHAVSRFLGRMFLIKSVREELVLDYRDYIHP